MLTETEGLGNVLSVYSKVKQPEVRAQWLHVQVYPYDEGALTNMQNFTLR